FVEQGLTDGGLVVEAGTGDFRIPALRSLGGFLTSGARRFNRESLCLLDGGQTILRGCRLLGGRLEIVFELPDLLVQGFRLGGRVVRLGDGVNLRLNSPE